MNKYMITDIGYTEVANKFTHTSDSPGLIIIDINNLHQYAIPSFNVQKDLAYQYNMFITETHPVYFSHELYVENLIPMVVLRNDPIKAYEHYTHNLKPYILNKFTHTNPSNRSKRIIQFLRYESYGIKTKQLHDGAAKPIAAYDTLSNAASAYNTTPDVLKNAIKRGNNLYNSYWKYE